MISSEKKFEWKLLIGVGWMVFNLSLAVWWMIFSLRQIDSAPHQKMLISEGVILILSLLLGGGALLSYIAAERRRNDQIRQFFGTFSHELKTSLASLRLQAESLADDFKDSTSNPLFQRLVKDSVRLEIQLDNSLLLAQKDSNQFFIEKIGLRRLLSSLEHHWPEVKIDLLHDVDLMGDRRALESIFRNLIQNSVVHGGASHLRIEVAERDEAQVYLAVRDDGAGFEGKRESLGKLFLRHTSRSGSGVGLFLVRALTEKMGGQVKFLEGDGGGFSVLLKLPTDGVRL